MHSLNRWLPVMLAGLVLTPGHALAQADWTFRVPLTVTNVPAVVDMGAVLCVVSSDDQYATGQAVSERGETMNAVDFFGYTPGEPMPEWEAIRPPESRFVGFQLFEPTANGEGPSDVTVEVVAPEGTREALKINAKNWACALVFHATAPSGQASWSSPHPDYAWDGVGDVVAPTDGSSPVLWVSGVVP